MIADLKPYPAYKDSGVEWLGEIPEHWEVRKLRSILRAVTERNRADLPLLSVVRSKGVIIRDVADHSDNHNFIPDDLSNYKVVRKGQFAMNKMKAWQGSYGVSQYDGIVSPAYYVFDTRDVYGNFFNMAVRSKSYVPFFLQSSDGVRIGQWDLSQSRMREIGFVLPPLAEQTAIVRYLNHVDRKVRRFVRAKRKLIALLEEQKRAIIHQAVTRGLDPNVPMKDSGIEWLGEVPEGWEVVRVKHILREVDTRSIAGQETHLSMSQKLGLVPSDMVTSTLTSESYAGGKLCQVNDLVLNRLKAHLGVFAIASQDGVISPDYSVFRLKINSNILFFERLFKSMPFRRELRTRAKGIVEGFWRLYTDDFFDIHVPLPPQSEQDRIVFHTDELISYVDTTITRTQREISLIEEYRTRLISDVVTGKLDVREAAATLPEGVEGEEPEEIETDEGGEVEEETDQLLEEDV